MAPAAGTANTDASMHADSAAGANTPSRLSLGLSFDIAAATLQAILSTDQVTCVNPLTRDRHRRAIRFARSQRLECETGGRNARLVRTCRANAPPRRRRRRAAAPRRPPACSLVIHDMIESFNTYSDL
ncbi:hypothetical protein O0L34_g2807 [Tuta absoluta]|nr:hypothetical protein O0L34_g2807 [Tuta absoluta]